MLKRILRLVATMITGAAITAPVSLNYENMVIKGGYDNVLSCVWNGIINFAGRAFDPAFAWLFWLAIGATLGFLVASWFLRLERTTRGSLGGPSFRYLRWEARTIRMAIAWPWLRRISSDFDQDLDDLNEVLTKVHGFPGMPTITFADPVALDRTSEYLRLILPNLDRPNLDEAREVATRYLSRLSSPP